jgi:hypothetical protein
MPILLPVGAKQKTKRGPVNRIAPVRIGAPSIHMPLIPFWSWSRDLPFGEMLPVNLCQLTVRVMHTGSIARCGIMQRCFGGGQEPRIDMSSASHDWTTVSVIIPTYNGAATLRETLAAIRRQDYPALVEIVAVDSESRDDTRALLEQAGARILNIPQRRFTHGYSRNLGAREASGEILVFMSQDALPEGDQWLQGIVSTLADPHVGAMYVRQKARPDATPFEEYFHLQLYPPHSARYDPPEAGVLSLDRIFFSNVQRGPPRHVLAVPLR